ncbi:hypothetical protein MRB53_023714 [Persea americana]|uniref:Uncharacterized protein n=1 Tax=Persea americana TaxID=3435 RepID=A0ACC2LAD9_PERAE|nr:hypothetical protein MRB53_023714 [Persea americana]
MTQSSDNVKKEKDHVFAHTPKVKGTLQSQNQNQRDREKKNKIHQLQNNQPAAYLSCRVVVMVEQLLRLATIALI